VGIAVGFSAETFVASIDPVLAAAGLTRRTVAAPPVPDDRPERITEADRTLEEEAQRD
jgi:hypothetical protein